MNVIVANRNFETISNLGIDIIKSVNGQFEIDDIIKTFQNFFFQRMILDITALKDYQDVKTLQKLSISFDMDKIILLLDGSDESNSPAYLSKLISMGIYNFTTTKEGILYLYNNPNSYRDVAHIHQIEAVQVVENVTNDFAINQHQGQRIIGFKNVTPGAGATTLSYMIKKELEKNYKTVGFEIDKRDFMYFNDKEMISTNGNEINSLITKFSNHDVIIMDVNNNLHAEGLCHEVIYLVEPSILKLNKLMSRDNESFTHIKDKKVILNQSMLARKDILDFEYEAKIKLFYNMPPLNERQTGAYSLNDFLIKLGFDRQSVSGRDKKINILGAFTS